MNIVTENVEKVKRFLGEKSCDFNLNCSNPAEVVYETKHGDEWNLCKECASLMLYNEDREEDESLKELEVELSKVQLHI